MGYGAAAGVIADMRRQYRRDEARREARRNLARAGRTELRRRNRAAAHGPSTRAAFPCAFACADCLTMQWPTPPTNAHPLRNEPHDAGAPKNPCRECGGGSWIDLAVPEHAQMLLEPHDDFDRKHRRARRQLWVGTLFMSVVGAWLAFEPPGPVLSATLLLSVTWFVVHALRTAWSLRRPPRALTLGRPSCSGRQVVTAPVESDAVLHAPLTGRPCVGYHLRLSLRDDRRPRLDERRMVDASVGKVMVGPEFGLDIDGPVETRTIDGKEPRMERLLRERGLDPDVGTWVGIESIVRAGDPATLVERGTVRSLVA